MTSLTEPDSRDRVLAVVQQATAPVSIEDIAERTDLHVNTVRGHLEVLLATGAISRTQGDVRGRGRPRWFYLPAIPTPSPFQRLAEALTMELGQIQDPALAAATADRWAHSLPDLPRAATPDDAVTEAADALNRLGFAAEVSAIGDAISVRQCPYAALVQDNPVICQIHAALIDSLLEQTGQPVRLQALQVWTRPGMCVARLQRPDLEPERVIRTQVQDSNPEVTV